MADNKLIGQNYTTPDLVAKVTGKAKYAEDFRAEGMLFAKLLLSPMPHARVTRIDTSAALAMPGVKAILTVDDLPGAAAGANLGENVVASAHQRARPDDGADVRRRADSRRRGGRRAHRGRSDREDRDRVRAAAVRGRSDREPASRQRRTRATQGNVWMRPPRRGGRAARAPRRAGAAGRRTVPPLRRRRRSHAAAPTPRRSAAARQLGSAAPARAATVARPRRAAPRRQRRPGPRSELKWTRRLRRAARASCRWASHRRVAYGDIEAGFKEAALVLDETFVGQNTEPPGARTALGDGLLAERQAVSPRLARRARCRPSASIARWVGIPAERRRAHQRVHRRRLRQPDSRATSRWRFRRCCRRRPTRR